jgi:membrane-bound lytic murein transglycosylase B
MRWFGILLSIVLTTGVAAADPAGDEATARRHGWGYLVDKLAADGVPSARVAAAFADPRVPPFDGLGFTLAPRESLARYRSLRSPATIRAARQCRDRHAEAFAGAEREGVPASIVAAIVQVESACGRATGSSTIFHRLARLAMANEPDNVAWNVRRHVADSGDPAIVDHVHARARYLEETFYPELRGLFTMADRYGIDVLAMQGSASGAFGFPQFLPTSYLRYGVDADGDGRVSLYDMSDAAASCARFLAEKGWRPGLSVAEQRRVIWQYNRSEPYVDTILALHRQLDQPASASVATSVRRPHGGGAARSHRPASRKR